MSERSLKDVLHDIATGQRTLDNLDDDISQKIQQIQTRVLELRPKGYPVDVPFEPWGRLGWSGRKGRWRFVVIDDDECEDLLNMPRLCRSDACAVLHKLIVKLGVLK